MVLKCPICGHKTNSLWSMKSHIARKHSLNGFCPVCGKKFRRLVAHFAQQARKGCSKHAIFFVLYHRCNRLKAPETYHRYAPAVIKALEEGATH